LFGADQDAEFELDIVQPHVNVHGLIPMLATRVKVENGTLSVTKLVLKQPFADARDFSEKLIKAELSIDPPGVKITTPTISRGMRDTTEVKAMFARDVNNREEECEAHKVICHSLEINKDRITRETLYTFPDNFRCTNAYFNGDLSDPLRLVSKIDSTAQELRKEKVADPDEITGEIIVKTIGVTLCARWELFVVGSEQRFESDALNEPTEEALLSDLLDGMLV
jgi:hypothetical protein